MVKNTFPSLKDLELVRKKIKNIRNRRGEFKRQIHYGCYLLCSQSGLRISEAVRFDLNAKTKKGLYRIEKPKGKKERYVIVPKKVISELKENNWKPNQTNRWNFYHFLKKTKQEANINQNVKLTPHNLRRTFATYHAESGLPLPLLSKLLGHSSIRTTALYWQNIYGDDDPNDILVGKKWLENREKEPPKAPITESSPEQLSKNPDSDISKNKPVVAIEKLTNKDNSLLIAESEKKPTITNYQPKPLINKVSSKTPKKFLLDTSTNKQTEILLINNNETNDKEQILLTKIKQLEEQLKEVKVENQNLTAKLTKTEALFQAEQQRANYYEQQLKTIAKSLYQRQKINYYKQLEKEQEAKIEHPPPFKPSK